MAKKKPAKKKGADRFDFIDFLNAKYGTRDSDNDGLTDEVERLLGTDPYQADTDHDGMSDAAEIRAGRNPLGPGDFRDWFVPHEGNNYQPHALHPKRVMFYAVSAVAMKILVVAFVLGLPMTAWLSPDLLKDQADKIIQLTNAVRAKVGVNNLSENQVLNSAAYAKASDMILQQYFAHIGPDKKTLASWLKAAGYRFEVAGENLAMGFSQPEAVMAAWQKSQTHYANIIDSDFTQIGVGVVSGPYQGEDTVLVAQYFGRPAPAVTPVKPSAPKFSPVKSAAAADSRQQVAPAKVLAPLVNQLVKPVALDLPDSTVTSQSALDLKIFAPGAEAVYVVGKNGKMPAEAAGDNNTWQLKLNLEPGKNIFYLLAANGSRELTSANYEVTADSQPPLLDEAKTSLSVDFPQGSQEAVVRAAVYLSADATAARLSFGDYRLDLAPLDGAWRVQQVVPDRRALQPLVPPEITATDAAGNSKTYSLSWSNFQPLASSRSDRYLFLRANPAPGVAKLFGVSDWFYRLILFGSVMSLTVAVVVEVKKQRPKMIMATGGLIALLIVLLIF